MRLKSVFDNRIKVPLQVWWQDARHHNGSIGFYRFIASVSKGTSIGSIASKRVQIKISKKLCLDFYSIIEKYKNDDTEVLYDSQAPVWVLWMQGYKNAPDIVKRCIDSIRVSTSHPVHLITSDNISKYYSFPNYINEKYINGTITNAQFSDILRMALLADYGGLWIDATIFIPTAIPEGIFEREFFTCKRDIKNTGYVSEYRWTSFLNGCKKGCVIQRAAKDMFFVYWEKYDYLVDYLLVDYILLLIYENIPKATRLMDDLPYNNSQIEELQNRMNEVFDEKAYQKLVTDSDTDFFKLSWRMKFETSKNGKKTYFGSFLQV